ncbi:MAG: dUTP diphosphatase [Deltaproteobacteria bacterium]|nr:dUTP diphosphatase [Deltaproteobacteria bacterium]
MILLHWDEGCEPVYQSEHSVAADVCSRVDVVIPAQSRAQVPTGLRIARVLWDEVPHGMIPELQIRARSGLAYKSGINLSNGVGTIDADYPDEIAVLLSNTSQDDFQIRKGERIAQIALNLCVRIPELSVRGKRLGGFGSTGY